MNGKIINRVIRSLKEERKLSPAPVVHEINSFTHKIHSMASGTASVFYSRLLKLPCDLRLECSRSVVAFGTAHLNKYSGYNQPLCYYPLSRTKSSSKTRRIWMYLLTNSPPSFYIPIKTRGSFPLSSFSQVNNKS